MKNVFFAILFGLFAVSVSAADFNYNYVEVQANVLDVKNAANGNTGFEVALSKSITDTVFVNASFNRNDLAGADVDLWRAGVNLRTPISDVVDFYVGGFGQRALVDYDSVVFNDFSSYGYGALAGVRWSVFGDRAEVGATFESSRLTASSSWVQVGALNARVGLTQSLSLVGEVRFEDSANEYLAGVRYQF